MQMISGTIKNAVQLQALNGKWQQKKDSGKLTKEERNARENWTQEDYIIQDIKDQAEQNRKVEHDTKIDNKIMAGGTLTPDEEKYLEQNNPEALKKYKEIKAEKKSYEEKLRKCKTKDEVERVKLNTMGEYALSLKKVVNDPLIPKSEKLAKAQEMLAKTNNVQDVHISFVSSPEYEELPTEGEEAVERTEERQAQYDSLVSQDDSADTVEGEENAADSADTVDGEESAADGVNEAEASTGKAYAAAANDSTSRTDTADKAEKNDSSHEEHRRAGKKASSVHPSSVAMRTDIIIDDIKDVCVKLIGQSVNFTI